MLKDETKKILKLKKITRKLESTWINSPNLQFKWWDRDNQIERKSQSSFFYLKKKYGRMRLKKKISVKKTLKKVWC
jgi:hypothetical protein